MNPMPSLPRRPWSTAAALLALLSLSACSNPPSRVDRAPGDAETLRTLDTGTVLGYANPFGGHTWLGIPFAAPPVGSFAGARRARRARGPGRATHCSRASPAFSTVPLLGVSALPDHAREARTAST